MTVDGVSYTSGKAPTGVLVKAGRSIVTGDHGVGLGAWSVCASACTVHSAESALADADLHECGSPVFHGESCAARCKPPLVPASNRTALRATCNRQGSGGCASSSEWVLSSPCVCPEYSTSVQPVSGRCECQAGRFLRSEGEARGSECVTCSAGKWAKAGAESDCTPCPPGRSSAHTGSTALEACVECVLGTYSSTEGSSVCTACPADTVGTSPGQSSKASACRRCGAGAYRTVREGRPTCELCEAGTYSNLTLGEYLTRGHRYLQDCWRESTWPSPPRRFPASDPLYRFCSDGRGTLVPGRVSLVYRDRTPL